MSVYKILVEIQEAFEQQSFFLPPIMKQKIADILAAHYEPVREPPAEVHCRCDVEMFGKHCDWCPLFREICNSCAMPYPKHAIGCPAAPSVSEEQPAPPEVLHMLKIKNAHLEDDEPAAPHRATIAVHPCPMRRKCCGTEAEAKAKLESLRGSNAE